MTLGGVAMENNKFTKQSIEAIKCAKDLACDLGMNYIGTEHILAGIAKITMPVWRAIIFISLETLVLQTDIDRK